MSEKLITEDEVEFWKDLFFHAHEAETESQADLARATRTKNEIRNQRDQATQRVEELQKELDEAKKGAILIFVKTAYTLKFLLFVFHFDNDYQSETQIIKTLSPQNSASGSP